MFRNMKMEYMPPTESERQRSSGFKEHARSGMTFQEAVRLNAKALSLFPVTEEERRLKTEDLMAMPEFAL